MTTYRTGRHEHRCIRVQLGAEPSDSDPLIGTMDVPELGQLVVELLNAHEAGDRVRALYAGLTLSGDVRCGTCGGLIAMGRCVRRCQ